MNYIWLKKRKIVCIVKIETKGKNIEQQQQKMRKTLLPSEGFDHKQGKIKTAYYLT